MIDENNIEIKTIFADVINHCNTFNKFNKLLNQYKDIKFSYRELDGNPSTYWAVGFKATVSLGNQPVFVCNYHINNISLLDSARVHVKNQLMSDIFCAGIIRGKESLDLLKNKQLEK